MKLTRPSVQAKEVPIGARYTGQHKLLINSETGEYRESLPPIAGATRDIQRLLLTKVPAQRALTLADRVGIFVAAAVSTPRPVLNAKTGVMQ